MKWLFWKDYRLNWLIVIMALIVVAVPHTLAVISACYGFIHNTPILKISRNPTIFSYLSATLCVSTLWSLIFSPIVFTFMGGNTIACERADRSAEFLAYLPISRSRILTSKLLVAFLIGAFIWIANLSILGSCWSSFQQLLVQPDSPVGKIVGGFLIAGLTFFCVAWLFSSFLESPAISAGIGLFAPLLLAYVIGFIVYYFGLVESISFMWPMGFAIALSLASFVGGTWYYLRRVEP